MSVLVRVLGYKQHTITLVMYGEENYALKRRAHSSYGKTKKPCSGRKTERKGQEKIPVPGIFLRPLPRPLLPLDPLTRTILEMCNRSHKHSPTLNCAAAF